MDILARVIHGSYLYGLENESSDKDYKAIHLPSIRDCLCLQACKNVNSKDEANNIENESFALQRFLQLASNAESITIDMLHCSDKHNLQTSEVWEFLRLNKHKFYTKEMTSALGYAKNMAFKYGRKANRLEAVKKVSEILHWALLNGINYLYQCWDYLPDGDHIYRTVDEQNLSSDNRLYEIAGKKLQATMSISYALEIVDRMYQRYGQRVQSINSSDGVDWKAISHSFRVGYQLYHIYAHQGFSYPLPETEFLKDLKYGKFDFVNDNIDITLDLLITNVEQFSKVSSYPDKVDQKWIEEIILNAYEKN